MKLIASDTIGSSGFRFTFTASASKFNTSVQWTKNIHKNTKTEFFFYFLPGCRVVTISSPLNSLLSFGLNIHVFFSVNSSVSLSSSSMVSCFKTSSLRTRNKKKPQHSDWITTDATYWKTYGPMSLKWGFAPFCTSSGFWTSKMWTWNSFDIGSFKYNLRNNDFGLMGICYRKVKNKLIMNFSFINFSHPSQDALNNFIVQKEWQKHSTNPNYTQNHRYPKIVSIFHS